MNDNTQLAQEYIEQNRQEYLDWLGRASMKIFDYRFTIVATLCVLGSVNFLKTGWAGCVSLSLPIAALLLSSSLEKLVLKKARPRHLIHIVDFFALMLELHGALIFAFTARYARMSVNAPLLQVCLLGSIFCYHPTTRRTLIRNIVFGGVVALIGMLIHPKVLPYLLEQTFLGVVMGSAANYVIRNLRDIEFFYVNTNVSMKVHVLNELSKVIYPHQAALIGQGNSIESTMPVGKAQCIAIVLDVCNSTSYQSDEFKQLLAHAMGRCYEAMMQGYSGTTAEARAFRVKENYDGFLCTMGFPFVDPEGASPHEHCVRLIESFLEIFDQTFAGFSSDRPVSCGVGMAEGEGYLPSIGPKLYDMRGMALVLATRYESLRKMLDIPFQDSHVVIISEKLQKNLPTVHREKFQHYALQKDQSIRDDAAARGVYVRIILRPNQLAARPAS